jgi:hypothetical protein
MSSGEHPITSQELQMIELKRWIENGFASLKDEQDEYKVTLKDIHDRVIRIEVKQEMEEANKALVKNIKTEGHNNPLNKSMGNFLGDVVVTALKTAAVAIASALLLIGYDFGRKEKPAIPAYPPQPPPQPTNNSQQPKGQQP